LPEWLYEAGIGEARAALVEQGSIVEARIELEGILRVGTVLDARLTDRSAGRITLPDGTEAHCAPIPRESTEGASLRVRIVREAIPEKGRPKPPRAVPAPGEPLAEGPDLLSRITFGPHSVRTLRSHEPDLLEAAGWSEVLEEARTGEIAFPGGQLRLAVTPAMSLFDVDGAPPLGPLAVAAARAAVRAIVRLDIGGSIGIDFPTLSNKAERQAVADVIDAELPQPFERTALNGFGFLQIVRRRERPSLPELLAADPVGAETRAELRRLERLLPPLPASHILSENVRRRLEARADWSDALARRIGGRIAFVAPQEKSIG